MTIANSGPISFKDINTELEKNPTSLVSFNDNDVRDLVDSTQNTQLELSEFRGKWKKIYIKTVNIRIETHRPDSTADGCVLEYFRCWNSKGVIVVDVNGIDWGNANRDIVITPLNGYCLDIARVEFRHAVPSMPRYYTMYPIITCTSERGAILPIIGEPINERSYITNGIYETVSFSINSSDKEVSRNELPVRF